VTPFSHPLLLVALCGGLAAGCSGGVSIGGSVSSLQGPSANASLSGNWAMMSPSSIGLEIFQSGSSLDGVAERVPLQPGDESDNAPGHRERELCDLAGKRDHNYRHGFVRDHWSDSLGNHNVWRGHNLIHSDNIASVTGQWNGTFTAHGPTILGTGVFIQATSTVNGQTVIIIGKADPTGHIISVTGYSVRCGTTRYVHPSEDAVLSAISRLGGHKSRHSDNQPELKETTQRQLTQ